jgi:putative CocE/NonD family hydrolase
MNISRRQFLATTGAALTAPAIATGEPQKAAPAGWTLPPKRAFKSIENVWVPMRDGTRIAMRLWLPDGAEAQPVPAVMEYIPYRKRDGTRPADDAWAEQFVPYGFAFARPDVRGSGDSEGVLVGEYLQQEQEDGVEIIAWLAKQPWCNGSVGVRGISWGGFGALQLAAMAPPALKAIMPHCATDNRFTDDAHYIGGALGMTNFDWGTNFKGVMIAPPDPAIVGEDRWRDMWRQRLKATPPILADWLRHQRFDAFWQHGSVQRDYSKIKCAVYAVGGQIDSYRDFIPRLLAGLSAPRKGLMGSWGHAYPQNANPGPGLDWVAEEVRWWSHWLNGAETGIMNEPMLRVYMQSQTASEVWPKDVPGRWVAEDAWPSPRIEPKRLFLNADGLGDAALGETIRRCQSQETVGLTKRAWLPSDMQQDLAPDQTPDDRRSLTFDSEPLRDDLEILGNAKAKLRVASDQPVARLAVRINEVTPDGTSWNVTYGLLNLTHRNGHEQPSPLAAGQNYDVDVSCYFTAHRFKKGNRIRVSITESLWPLVWPSPRPVTLSLTTGASQVTLPVRPPERAEQPPPIAILRGRVEQRVSAGTASSAAAGGSTQARPDADGRVNIEKHTSTGPRTLEEVGTTITATARKHASIREGDPTSAVWRMESTTVRARGAWNTRIETAFELTSTPEEFHVTESVRALEGEAVVHEQRWDNRVRRDLM